MVFILIWTFVNLRELGRASDAILRENYRSILASENMVYALERQDSAILLIFLGFEDEGWKQFRENEGQFFQWLGRAKDHITIEAMKLGAVDFIQKPFSPAEIRERVSRIMDREKLDEQTHCESLQLPRKFLGSLSIWVQKL
jgi:DNA-binding response OmpR family regulator